MNENDRDNWYSCGIARIIEVAKAIGRQHAKFLLDCAASSYNMWSGGNQWAQYDSWLTFFSDVVGMKFEQHEGYRHWRVLAERSGPRVMHKDFCIISDRPAILTVDAQNRPHNDSGPFCVWRDGSALFSIHGVRVPRSVVEHPEGITVERVQKEKNSEVQRVMMERFGGAKTAEEGIAAYIAASGAKRIAADDYGELYAVELADGEVAKMVLVTNGTKEPDGTFKKYALSVNPELRPMRRTKDGRIEYGEPQKDTARNAVASTYFMRGEEYQVAVRT